jgi:uncharacterized membrane protein
MPICEAECRPVRGTKTARAVRVTFARWLIAPLTFEPAADIADTSFEPTWFELGSLGSFAEIRAISPLK